jgi:hypothetical protein
MPEHRTGTLWMIRNEGGEYLVEDGVHEYWSCLPEHGTLFDLDVANERLKSLTAESGAKIIRFTVTWHEEAESLNSKPAGARSGPRLA